MASTGIVTTGRGLALNLDDLIRKAEIPLGYKEGKATKASPAYKPVTDQKPRIRGFIPAHGEASAPAAAVEETVTAPPTTPKIASAYSEDGTARTMADITGIRVKETERTRQLAIEARGVEDVEVSEEEEQVLGDLVKELKTSKPGPKKSRKKAAAE